MSDTDNMVDATSLVEQPDPGAPIFFLQSPDQLTCLQIASTLFPTEKRKSDEIDTAQDPSSKTPRSNLKPRSSLAAAAKDPPPHLLGQSGATNHVDSTDSEMTETAPGPSDSATVAPSGQRTPARLSFAPTTKVFTPTRLINYRFLARIQPTTTEKLERFGEIQDALGKILRTFNSFIARHLELDKDPSSSRVLPENTSVVVYPWRVSNARHRGIPGSNIANQSFSVISETYYGHPTGHANSSKDVYFRVNLGWADLPIDELRRALDKMNSSKDNTAWLYHNTIQAEDVNRVGFLQNILPHGKFDKHALSDEVSAMCGMTITVTYGGIHAKAEKPLRVNNKLVYTGLLFETASGSESEARKRLSAVFPSQIVPGRIYPMGLRGIFINTFGVYGPALTVLESLRKLHRQMCTVTSSIIRYEVHADTPLLQAKPHLTVARILMDILSQGDSPYFYALIAAIPDPDSQSIILLYKDENSDRVQVIYQFMYAICQVHAYLFVSEAQNQEFQERLASCFSASFIEENRAAVFNRQTQTFSSMITDDLLAIHQQLLGDPHHFRTKNEEWDDYDSMSLAEKSRRTGNPPNRSHRLPPGSIYAQPQDDFSSMAPSMSTQSRKGLATELASLRDANAALHAEMATMRAFISQSQVPPHQGTSQDTTNMDDGGAVAMNYPEEAVVTSPTNRGPSFPQATPFIISDHFAGLYGHPTTSRSPDTFRILGGNVGGLTPTQSCQPRQFCPGACKDCFLLSKAQDLDAQVCCWNEINVNWHNISEQHRPQTRYCQWFSSCHIQQSSIKGPFNVRHQYGGTMMWTIDSATHRLDSSKSGNDSLGRWSWNYFRGRSNKSLVTISAYRPVRNTQGAGSVFNQQAVALLQKGDTTDPIVKFDQDLSTLLATFVQQGSSIVLLIDANTHITYPTNPFAVTMRSLGLHNAIQSAHPDAYPTRRNGSEVIDGIFVTEDLLGSPCGYTGWLTDHCALFIDLSLERVFGHPLPPIVTLTARRLQLKDQRVVSKFLQLLHSELLRRNLLDRATDLEAQFLSFNHAIDADPSFYPPASFVEAFNSVDADFITCLQKAEAGCRKFRTGAISWTPQYALIMDRLYLLRGLLSIRRSQASYPTSRHRWSQYRRLARALDLMDYFSFSISQLKREIQTLETDRTAYAKVHDRQRVTYLDSLAAAQVEHSNVSFHSARSKLVKVEEQRLHARRIRSALNPHTKKGAVSMIEIDTPQGVAQLTSQQSIEQAIFTENLSKYFQASDTPFQCDPLFGRFGPLGSDRSASVDDIATSLSVGTNALLHSLRPSPPSDFTLPQPYDAFVRSWSRQKERTSSYPSRHFGHLKACMQHPGASRIAYLLETLPPRTGLNPSSWCNSVDVMIEKQPGVFHAKKLRTIVLFDPVANHAFKSMGREMMSVAERNNLLAPEQHGSRHGRRANWAALEQRLTCDLSRQSLQPAAIIFNDAVGCYDRIVHSVASLCMQQAGVPPSATNCMFRCLQDMKHQVRTVFGDSATFYQSSDWVPSSPSAFAVPISGVGQGNGAGPQIWAVISTPIANALRQADLGFLFNSALSGEPISYVGFIFVDDATIGCSSPGWDAAQVIQQAQTALSLWEDTLRATGGAVSPEKTFWYLLDYVWSPDHDSWKYRTKIQYPAELSVPDSTRQLRVIDRLDPSEARRTLGVHLAPDHNEDLQFSVLRQKSSDWASRLYLSGLSDSLAWMAYQSTISKSLAFSLPVTCLSKQALHKAWGPAIQATLHKMGVGKDLPLAVRYGSLSHQGLGIDHPYFLQIIAHLECLLVSPEQPKLTMSKLMRASCEYMILEFGFPCQLFEADPSLWEPCITTSWVKSTWQMCFDYGITIATDLPAFRLRREHDAFLMLTFQALGVSPKDLALLNRVRLYLQVITLSDISSADGSFLLQSCTQIQKDPLLSRTEYQWPQLPRPSKRACTLWVDTLSRFCVLRSSRLIRPLGDWLPHSLSTHPLFYSRNEDRAFLKTNDSIQVYPRSSPGSSWFVLSTMTEPHLPEDCVCATGRSFGDRISLNSYSTRLHPTQIALRPSVPLSSPDWATSRVIWPSDRGQHVSECLQRGTAKLVSDGSYDPVSQRCVASFIITGTDPALSVRGSLPSPGPYHIQDSYRGELTGIYGGVLALDTLCSRFSVTEGSILIACDGKAALDQSVEYHDRPSIPFCSHNDGISTIRHLVRHLPLKVQTVHVKGHQRERGGFQGTQLIGPLDELATLNDAMDENAKSFRVRLPETSFPTCDFFPSPTWLLCINSHPIVLKHHEVLKTQMSTPDLLQYWSVKRHKFGELHHSVVDWQATHKCMTSLSRKRRIHTTKIASTFVAVRHRQHLRRLAESHFCPRCSAESRDIQETVTHLFSCPSVTSQELWATSLSTLQSWLSLHGTDPHLADMILQGLRSWTSQSIPVATVPPSYSEVWSTQQAVGWQSLLEGRMVLGWADAQEKYYRSIGSPITSTGRRWLTQLLRKLLDIAWDQWEHRNGILHHRTEGALRSELLSQVQKEYQLGHGHIPALRRLFAPGLQRISMRSTTQLNLWATTVRTHRANPPLDRALQAQQQIMENFVLRL